MRAVATQRSENVIVDDDHGLVLQLLYCDLVRECVFIFVKPKENPFG